MAKIDKERTYYSEEVAGDKRNFEWTARFDYTDGYLGIDQRMDGKLERLLLSPAQVKELIRFYSDPTEAT